MTANSENEQLYKTELFINLADVDECLSTPSVCGPNSTCINTVGGYNCFCWNGFTATNSSLRVNISNPCRGESSNFRFNNVRGLSSFSDENGHT